MALVEPFGFFLLRRVSLLLGLSHEVRCECLTKHRIPWHFFCQPVSFQIPGSLYFSLTSACYMCDFDNQLSQITTTDIATMTLPGK